MDCTQIAGQTQRLYPENVQPDSPEDSAHKGQGDNSFQPPTNPTEMQGAIDAREQLTNDGEIGSFAQVSIPESMITSQRGILFDFDPGLYRHSVAPADVLASPVAFFDAVISKFLARDPVLQKAEVRVSGVGVHAILRFREPIQFPTVADRQRWAAIVKVIQRLLPVDPHCPGITALTRPVGSVNSKNGGLVCQIRAGEGVPFEDVLGLYERARISPFRIVASLLFGAEHISPCPICASPRSRLDVLDKIGDCYESCGKVRLGQLIDVFLAPRPAKPKE